MTASAAVIPARVIGVAAIAAIVGGVKHYFLDGQVTTEEVEEEGDFDVEDYMDPDEPYVMR